MRMRVTSVHIPHRISYGNIAVGDTVGSAVAHLQETQAGVLEAALVVSRPAKTVLRAHRDKGDARIAVHIDPRFHPDVLIELEDDRGYGIASAIERGHYNARSRRFVDGIHALRAIKGVKR